MAQTGEEIRQNGSETLRRLARALCKQVRVLRLVFPSWRLDELVPAIENQMDTFANLGYDPEKFPHRTKRRYAMFMLKLSRLGIDARRRKAFKEWTFLLAFATERRLKDARQDYGIKD